MMPRSEGQALPSRLVHPGFRRPHEDRGSLYIPGAAGMSEGRQRRPACGPRLLARLMVLRMDWLGSSYSEGYRNGQVDLPEADRRDRGLVREDGSTGCRAGVGGPALVGRRDGQDRRPRLLVDDRGGRPDVCRGDGLLAVVPRRGAWRRDTRAIRQGRPRRQVGPRRARVRHLRLERRRVHVGDSAGRRR